MVNISSSAVIGVMAIAMPARQTSATQGQQWPSPGQHPALDPGGQLSPLPTVVPPTVTAALVVDRVEPVEPPTPAWSLAHPGTSARLAANSGPTPRDDLRAPIERAYARRGWRVSPQRLSNKSIEADNRGRSPGRGLAPCGACDFTPLCLADVALVCCHLGHQRLGNTAWAG